MPGVTHCGRCGASLTLRSVVINVHPPRASRWAKVWRKTFMARFLRSARESSHFAERQWGLNLDAELPSMAIFCRLSVPGWAQIYAGHKTLGRGLFAGFAILLLASLACFGSPTCSILLGLAFSCHGTSVYDVARRSSPSIRDRIFRTLLGCGLLAALVYLPLYSIANRYVEVVTIQQDRSPLRTGDVLLLRRIAGGRATPRIGDVVQYQIPFDSVMGRRPDGYPARFEFRGARIDRILAGPGQSIVWEGGQLTVDGLRTSLRPLNPAGAVQSLSLKLPPDSWFILPSTDFVNIQFQATKENWERWSVVTTSQIEGRVVWRSSPWSRIGFVND